MFRYLTSYNIICILSYFFPWCLNFQAWWLKQSFRPFQKHRPCGVRVSFHIASFDSVDEQSMDYRLGIFLRMRWNDPRLKFPLPENGTQKTMTVHPDLISKIWMPDLFFSNEKEWVGFLVGFWWTGCYFCLRARFHAMITNNTLLRISYGGDVYVSIRLSLVLACHMPLHR